jgi:hypothetical protein
MAARERDVAERKENAQKEGTIAAIANGFREDSGVMVALVPLKPPIILIVRQEGFSPLTDKSLL